MKKALEWGRKNEKNVLLGVASVSLLLFITVAFTAKAGYFAALDNATLLSVRSFESPSLDFIVPLLTMLGDALFICGITALLAVWFVYKKWWNKAVLLVAGVAGSAAMSYILKAITDRARPELWTHLVVETSQSFPSGHATSSMALALCVIVITRRLSYWRWIVIAAGVYVGSIAFTRLYAGVHYLTDVLAGWLIALMWVAVVTLIVHMNRQK